MFWKKKDEAPTAAPASRCAACCREKTNSRQKLERAHQPSPMVVLTRPVVVQRRGQQQQALQAVLQR
jgi:hypothetical protein